MSIQTAQHQIQVALYALLVPNGTLDATLASIGVTGVFDFRGVPQNQPFPYITIGDGQEMPDNAFGRRGYINMTSLHIFSGQPGTNEASTILARLNALIDQKPLVLSTHTHVSTMYERANWIADPLQFVTHVAVRYRVETQEG